MSESAKFLIEAFYALDSKSKDFVRNAISSPSRTSQDYELSDSWKKEIKRISKAVKDGSMSIHSGKEVMAEIKSMVV